ncbi:Ger(x)C family spore germination protein [Brevibacillus fortis]|uniref:Ger(X)C family spore germination protein n=1 Tax=Brevibacillus fortis TaxID=2126352 RepID=A0A2P7VK67_9BACL|nr:Ger(x)C family spore germination protein [Brevibacillus fortis]PSJ99607.1 Ger(x)C family spore germination protein [Brevibacillus fortis]
MRRRLGVLFGVLFVLLLFGLSGCGFKDIDKRFFVVAIGIDQGKEKQYKVSLKLAIPTHRIEPGHAAFQIISQEADTISQALELLNSNVDKELDLGHSKIFIIGRNLANDEILTTTDWIFRGSDVQRIEYMALANPSAEEILEASPRSERVPADSLILSFGHEKIGSSLAVTEYLYDFYNRMFELGKDPFLPVVSKKGKSFEVNQVALFNKKELKMVIQPGQTELFSQLVRKPSNFVVSVKKDHLRYSLLIQSFTYRYQIQTPRQQPPILQMDIKVRGRIQEANQALFDKNWGEIERIAEKNIENRYKNLLESMQKHQIDPIGFGLHYMARNHYGKKEWELWQEIYSKMKFNITVDLEIESTGIIK